MTSDFQQAIQTFGTRRALVLVAVGGLVVSLSIRLIGYKQSMWCDEMSMLIEYAHAPWQKIVAAGAGEYTPNNHFLFTVLVKILLNIFSPISADGVAWLIRLPSLIAGTFVPLALAWPFRRRSLLSAMLLLLFAAVNPFLVEYCDEARGYALMTLLGVLATNFLPDGSKRWPVAYGGIVAAMIYTVPVAGMLVIAHAFSVFALRKSARPAWVRGAMISAGILLLLFLPMSQGIWFYSQHPLATPDSFSDFINQLPRMASAGEHLPSKVLTEWVTWIAPVLVLIVGTFLARREPLLQMPITVMSSATILFVFVSAFLPSIGQVRFVPWCAIWMVMAITAIALEINRRWGLAKMLAVIFILAGWLLYRDILLLPSQPIREAILQADLMVPSDTKIFIGFLGANDTVNIYSPLCKHHQLIATPGPVAFTRVEQSLSMAKEKAPWAIISFEPIVRDSAPQFWNYIQANYELKARLPGRISSMAIYEPK